MNSFDPLLTSDGKPYAQLRYKEIIQEQVTIGYLTKGGVTYSDTEEMSPYERKIAMETIKEILKEQAEAQNQAMQKAMERKNSKKDPKSGLSR